MQRVQTWIQITKDAADVKARIEQRLRAAEDASRNNAQ
jgi:hypothetical protein